MNKPYCVMCQYVISVMIWFLWNPSEFCPGVPWKGLQNIDPETDPNMTPGSVPSGPTINTNIQDVNRYLLRDRSGGKRTNHLFSSKKLSFSELTFKWHWSHKAWTNPIILPSLVKIVYIFWIKGIAYCTIVLLLILFFSHKATTTFFLFFSSLVLFFWFPLWILACFVRDTL